eukprot:335401-Chlamydomonas_euryale.AAC.1
MTWMCAWARLRAAAAAAAAAAAGPGAAGPGPAGLGAAGPDAAWCLPCCARFFAGPVSKLVVGESSSVRSIETMPSTKPPARAALRQRHPAARHGRHRAAGSSGAKLNWRPARDKCGALRGTRKQESAKPTPTHPPPGSNARTRAVTRHSWHIRDRARPDSRRRCARYTSNAPAITYRIPRTNDVRCEHVPTGKGGSCCMRKRRSR